MGRSAFAALLALALAVGCGRGRAEAAASAPKAGSDGAPASVDAAAPEDPRVTDLWTHAERGEPDDLARLCREVGTDELIAESVIPKRRKTALVALAFSDDFTPLPFLVEIADTGKDAEAQAALATIGALVERPRTAEDREDALEIEEALPRLLGLAQDTKRPAARRIAAMHALRMLADRGWVSAAKLPTDL